MTSNSQKDELQAAIGKVLASYAGYFNTWTIELGLRLGLLEAVRDRPGISAADLAKHLGFDPLYVKVWCNAGYSGGLLERQNGGFALAAHMDKVLLDPEFPLGAGGTAFVLTALRDPLVGLRERFGTGRRIWWDETSLEFRKAVGMTGFPFYVRLVKLAFPKMPGVQVALQTGGRVLEMASGTGRGLIRLMRAYPKARFTAVDGDEETLTMARTNLAEAGLEGVQLIHSSLEEIEFEDEFDVVLINISLHEARDLKRVVENAHRALKRGGWFVVSDMPFPEQLEDMRTVPAQIMSGIQYFEAQIDDQLLPVSHYVQKLADAGFDEIETLDVTPVHAIVYGRK